MVMFTFNCTLRLMLTVFLTEDGGAEVEEAPAPADEEAPPAELAEELPTPAAPEFADSPNGKEVESMSGGLAAKLLARKDRSPLSALSALDGMSRRFQLVLMLK